MQGHNGDDWLYAIPMPTMWPGDLMLNYLIEAATRIQKDFGDLLIVIELEEGKFIHLKGVHVLEKEGQSIVVMEGGDPV